MLIFVLLAI